MINKREYIVNNEYLVVKGSYFTTKYKGEIIMFKFIRSIIVDVICVYVSIYGVNLIKAWITGGANPTILGTIILFILGVIIGEKINHKLDTL